MPAFSRAASRPGAAKSKDKAEGDEAAQRAGRGGAREQPGASKCAGGAAGDTGGTDHGGGDTLSVAQAQAGGREMLQSKCPRRSEGPPHCWSGPSIVVTAAFR